MKQTPTVDVSPRPSPPPSGFRHLLARIIAVGSLAHPTIATADPSPCHTPAHCLPPTVTIHPEHPAITIPHPALPQTHHHTSNHHSSEPAHFHAGLAADVLTLRIPTASGRGVALQPGSISVFIHENLLFPIGTPTDLTTQNFYIGAGISGGLAMVNTQPVLQTTVGVGTGFRIHYFSIGLVAEAVGRIATTEGAENTFHVQTGPVLCLHPADHDTSLCLSPQGIFDITTDAPESPEVEVALRFTGVLWH